MAELPGFFLIGVDGDTIMEKPPMPERWSSLRDAQGWIARKFKLEAEPEWHVIQEHESIPLVWSTTVADHVFHIMYIGSFAFHSGEKVDPTKIGLNAEESST